MSRNKSLGLLAGSALCLASSAGLAQDADRAYRAELLADAEGRSSLLAQSASVHHEHGHFGFRDASGNNSMYFGGFVQYRHMFNFADTASDDTDDFTHGGQLNRARLLMFGTVGSEDFEYFVQFGADPINFGYEPSGGPSDGTFSSSEDGDLTILDAVFKWSFEEFYVRFGQGRPAQGFEETTQPWDQQFMDRSLASDVLSPGRQQFIALGYDDGEMLQAEVFFSDGANTQNTDFTSLAEADAAVGGRVNAIFTGNPEDFKTQSSFPGSPEGFRAGFGGQWETHGDTGLGSPADFDAIYANADLEFRGDGFSIRGHGYVLFVDPAIGSELTHWGGAIRGGYFLTDNIEAFAGWEAIAFDEDAFAGDDPDDTLQNFIRAGANYFPFEDSTAVRFTAEVIIGIDNTSQFLTGVGNLSPNANPPDFSATRQNVLGEDDTEVGFGVQASVLN